MCEWCRFPAMEMDKGHFCGIPPTDYQVSCRESHIVHLQRDHVVEHWGIIDHISRLVS